MTKTLLTLTLIIFSNLTQAAIPSTALINPTSGGTGATQTFTATTADTAGTADVLYTWIGFSTGGSLVNSCTILIYPASNTMQMLNSAGSAWGPAVTLGSSAVLSNPVCSIPASSAYRTSIGAAWQYVFTPTFFPAFSGEKQILTFSSSVSNEWEAQHQIGNWTVPGNVGPPAVTGVTPAGSTAVVDTFTVNVIDPAGSGNTQYVWLRFGVPGTGGYANECDVLWRLQTNQISLMDDAGTGNWNNTGTIGQSGSILNNQCILFTGNSSKTLSGNNITVTAQIGYRNNFTGTHQIWGTAYGLNGQGWNWFTGGTWTPGGAGVNMTLTGTEINTHEMLLDDATGQYVERPTSISPFIVRLKNGKNVHIAAADNVKVNKLTHSWEPVGDEFVYHYKIDTSDNPYLMRLGIVEDQYVPIGVDAGQTQPKGWHGLVSSWANLGEAELSENSEFSVKSKWKPGLQAFFIMSHAAKEPIPAFAETENNVRIATAASIFNNSVRKFVIGPALAPDLSEEGLKELVQRWVEDYGFGFLGPYLSGTTSLDEIKTDDAFEQEILSCLRAATAK